jgi:hypothetical protein
MRPAVAAVAVRPPTGTVLWAGYTRIQNPKICRDFARKSGHEVSVGDRLTGRLAALQTGHPWGTPQTYHWCPLKDGLLSFQDRAMAVEWVKVRLVIRLPDAASSGKSNV